MSKLMQQPEISSLTGLRFWAAMFILLNHLLLGYIPRDNPYFNNLLSSAGIIGMDIFFILSGFIIHYNYHSKIENLKIRSLFEFFAARFARLYPLFIFLFAIELFTKGLHAPSVDVWNSLKYFLTMSQSWFYDLNSMGQTFIYMYPRSSISWSVSTEMLMYAAYPFLLLLFRYDKLHASVRILTLVLITILFSLGLRWLNNHMDVVDHFGIKHFGQQASLATNASYSFAFWFVFISPYVRVFEFIIGICVAQLFLKSRHHPIHPTEAIVVPLLGLCAVSFILATFLPNAIALPWIKQTFVTIGYYPFIAIVLYVCARYGDSLMGRFFSMPFLVKQGEYSYSIYLFHIFVYSAATHTLLGIVPTGIRIIILWIVIFSCAFILYRYIEMPGRKLLRSWLMVKYDEVVRGWQRMFT